MFEIKNVEPREFQLSILETCKNNNTLVVLPTGIGKTLISLLLAIERLNKFPESKILILSPTKPLSQQHINTFKHNTNIDHDKILLLTGLIEANKRKDLWQNSKVIVATPQTIQKDLENLRIDLKNFSMLCIDECITKGTLIKIGDESYKKIEEIYNDFIKKKEKTYVQSLNLKNGEIEPTLIKKVHKINNKNNIIKITLKNGQEIKVTEDHLILINDKNRLKWLKASDIKLDKKIVYSPYIKNNFLDGIIIKDEDVLDTYGKRKKILLNSSKNPVPLRLVKMLKEEDLLPIKYSNPKLKIIVSLIGHIYGDGWYTKENGQPRAVGFSGKIEDLIRIQKDLKLLNIKHSNIFSRKTHSIINDLKNGSLIVNGTSNSFYVSHNKLTRLIEALNIPSGAKTGIKVEIPSWLMHSPKIIKKEFLAALMGSEGYKPKIKKSTSQPYVIRLSFNKIEEMYHNGLKYAHQLKKLFKEFDLRCSIKIKNGNLRKDGKKTLKFLITLSNSDEQMIKFFKEIGYKYSFEKNKEGKKILNYLLYKKSHLIMRQELYNKVIRLRKNGLKYKEIYTKFKLSKNIIKHWLNKENPVKTSMNIIKFDDWIKINKKSYFNLDYIGIKQITKLKNQDYVYDLTLDKNHNYIANNFFVHNCHRSRENFANTHVARFYFEQALNPRVIALTASPGGTLDKIKDVMKNLNLDAVEIRSDIDKDVKQYVQKRDIELIEVELTKEMKDLHSIIKNVYLNKIGDLKKLGFTKPSHLINKKDLLMLQMQLRKNLNSGDRSAFYGISLTALLIKLDYMLELLEIQGLRSLSKFLEKLKQDQSKAAKVILQDKKIQEAIKNCNELVEKNIDHPKFDKLKEFILNEIKNNKNIKIILFANYRDTIDNIITELRKLDVKCVKLIGQNKGLTQKQQINTVKTFEESDDNILICSSIGEEGLDIKGVNVVIFYEAIPSEIRRIQRMGRVARLEAGKIMFLITKNTRDEAYFWSSYQKEKKMKKTLYGLKEKNIQEFLKEDEDKV